MLGSSYESNSAPLGKRVCILKTPSHGVMFCIGHGMSPHGIPTFPLMITPDDVSRAELGFSAAVGVVSVAEREL